MTIHTHHDGLSLAAVETPGDSTTASAWLGKPRGRICRVSLVCTSGTQSRRFSLARGARLTSPRIYAGATWNTPLDTATLGRSAKERPDDGAVACVALAQFGLPELPADRHFANAKGE